MIQVVSREYFKRIAPIRLGIYGLETGYWFVNVKERQRPTGPSELSWCVQTTAPVETDGIGVEK